jgi:cell division septal protein FtsQ
MAARKVATGDEAHCPREINDEWTVAWRVLRVVLPLVVVAAYLGGLAGWWWWTSRHDRSTVALSGPFSGGFRPDWLDASTLEEIAEGRSIYQRRLAGDAAAAYAVSPWVRRVVAVQRQFPDKLDVVLEVRRPAAYVKADRYYAVDREGVRLPGMPLRLRERSMPVIIGMAAPAPAVGERFNSTELADALDALESVQAFIDSCEYAKSISIAAVAVRSSEFAATGRATDIEMMTEDGMKIVWGRHARSGAPCYGQLSTAEKLAELEAQLRELSTLGKKARYVNIRVRPGAYALADG